jgi:hypothetical protein
MSKRVGPPPIKCYVSPLPSSSFASFRHFAGRALDYRYVIDDYVARDRDLRSYELTDDDWVAIRLVTNWLKSFRSATTQMSATKHATLSLTQAIFRGLQDSVKDSIRSLPRSVSPTLRDAMIRAHRKLSDYYMKFDESPFYVWSSSASVFCADV